MRLSIQAVQLVLSRRRDVGVLSRGGFELRLGVSRAPEMICGSARQRNRRHRGPCVVLCEHSRLLSPAMRRILADWEEMRGRVCASDRQENDDEDRDRVREGAGPGSRQSREHSAPAGQAVHRSRRSHRLDR